jgi:hypothetical protein
MRANCSRKPSKKFGLVAEEQHLEYLINCVYKPRENGVLDRRHAADASGCV